MNIVKEKNMIINEFNGYKMINIFKNFKKDGNIVDMGKAIISGGVRIPQDGFGVHDSDEFSYIIKGGLKSGTKSEVTTIKEGEFSYIPAGEHHWCENLSEEDCELIWFLLKKEEC